jgi:SAM-dependent methyltransferase
MLREHLTQEHDLASRRFEKIDLHVAWIHRELLGDRPGRVLDLGCGPGLYTSRLARLGHQCTGVDFSPASIAYAVEAAEREGLHCAYLQEDIRTSAWGSGYDLVMLIFGEFNVFRPSDAKSILRRAYGALSEVGKLLLELSTFESVREEGKQGTSWYSSPSGLFSGQPHLCLQENLWDERACVATIRYYIVDPSGDVARHASSSQAYTDEQLRALLVECGFKQVEFLPSLAGAVDEGQSELFVAVAHKRPESEERK